MAQIIDGKELAKNIRLKLKDEVIELKNADITPEGVLEMLQKLEQKIRKK